MPLNQAFTILGPNSYDHRKVLGEGGRVLDMVMMIMMTAMGLVIIMIMLVIIMMIIIMIIMVLLVFEVTSPSGMPCFGN